MLSKHLMATTRPMADKQNFVFWKDYRVTVLQPSLFRLEKNDDKKYRDKATQVVWFRDMEKQDFAVIDNGDSCVITTSTCALILKEKREDCRIVLAGHSITIDNEENLKGTYRTLDCYDGDYYVRGSATMRKKDQPEENKIKLGMGVCSKKGVAIFNDENSLTLAENGEVLAERGIGIDEYIFAYGDDYRGAVNALYLITGSVPKIPRFVFGNWWSRYYVYTDKSYLRLLNSFEENNIPLSVATIDMDWHYSKNMEGDLKITELGRNTSFYGGNNGWTGYTWNKNLFPDYRAFLKEIEKKKLKITLNLHPADGVRWWEDCYEKMAKAVGQDPKTLEWVKFDIANPDFINAYFEYMHKPYEEDGVRFWWIDWQQGKNSKIEGLDPLWSLNHYHYLDNAKNHGLPVILSRYSGIGAHRYPLGFSGDTVISWDTLEFLPEFTATATNVGYTWWSHDIGGHMFGEKNNELYLRHIQYGVFS
ncbi:MAG: alpha-xylosidase, partial [Clostridia bacterium]|nr:alpha-xylosidase [Clostridia bacterium]